jgi:hypothetical protein
VFNLDVFVWRGCWRWRFAIHREGSGRRDCPTVSSLFTEFTTKSSVPLAIDETPPLGTYTVTDSVTRRAYNLQSPTGPFAGELHRTPHRTHARDAHLPIMATTVDKVCYAMLRSKIAMPRRRLTVRRTDQANRG